jgi:hypothetical protein
MHFGYGSFTLAPVSDSPVITDVLHRVSLGDNQNHEPTTRELIYYRWSDPKRPDMVPPYATSIEGGGLIVLSPDESKVYGL